MTHAARWHRLLDSAFLQRVAHDGEDGGGHALVAARNRLRDMRSMGDDKRGRRGADRRVLLATLSVRTSGKDNAHLAGWLGKARVLAFQGEADRLGNATWDVYVVEPEPRPEQQGRAPDGGVRGAQGGG